MNGTTATPKTIGNDGIKAAAKKEAITVSELVEWGILSTLNMHRRPEHDFGDARAELDRMRSIHGAVEAGIIGRSAVQAAADAEGMTLAEFTELAILAAIDMSQGSNSGGIATRQMIEDYREEMRAFIPEIGIGKPMDRQAEQEELIIVEPEHGHSCKCHPFMHRLFTGDLKAVHGPNFGVSNEFVPEQEHHGLQESIRRILGDDFFNNMLPDLVVLEAMIHHNPNLRNEAAAIKTLVDAAIVLNEFAEAIEAA